MSATITERTRPLVGDAVRDTETGREGFVYAHLTDGRLRVDFRGTLTPIHPDRLELRHACH